MPTICPISSVKHYHIRKPPSALLSFSPSSLLFLPHPIPCSAISLTSLKRISYLIMAYLCYNLLYSIGQHYINFGCPRPPLPQCVWQPCDVSVQPDVNDPSRKRNSPRKTEREKEEGEGEQQEAWQ